MKRFFVGLLRVVGIITLIGGAAIFLFFLIVFLPKIHFLSSGLYTPYVFFFDLMIGLAFCSIGTLLLGIAQFLHELYKGNIVVMLSPDKKQEAAAKESVEESVEKPIMALPESSEPMVAPALDLEVEPVTTGASVEPHDTSLHGICQQLKPKASTDKVLLAMYWLQDVDRQDGANLAAISKTLKEARITVKDVKGAVDKLKNATPPQIKFSHPKGRKQGYRLTPAGKKNVQKLTSSILMPQ
ncbi:MAG TPA: hypothetical protein PLI09_00890 [Candidatus Hydrogenedentes bacterium]|mgnify:CR=1 FL=1|nr:hypothetical protein [Candidatus Hydrogenedentota bacterium]